MDLADLRPSRGSITEAEIRLGTKRVPVPRDSPILQRHHVDA